MTSANVINYTIFKDGIEVGTHRQNIMCKRCNDSLLKFSPPSDFTILAHGLDEDEMEWFGDEINLKDWLDRNRPEITFIEFGEGDKILLSRKRGEVLVLSRVKGVFTNEYLVRNYLGDEFHIHQNEIIKGI
jgi:hypothetical protein